MHGHCNFYPSTTKIFGARHRIRTGTPHAEAADFKSAVSTNFTTRAVTYQNSGASRETRTLNPFGTGFLDQRVYHSTTNAMNELYSKTTCVWRSFLLFFWSEQRDLNSRYAWSQTKCHTRLGDAPNNFPAEYVLQNDGARGGTRTRKTLVLSQVRLPITSHAQIFQLLVRRLLRATSFGALMKGSLAEYP